MQTVIYDGSFEGFLCAVFDVYEYRFTDAEICTLERYNGNLFGNPHQAINNTEHSRRVWQALQKKLGPGTSKDLYRCFLSEEEGIENVLLRYIRYCFSTNKYIGEDYSHEAVIRVENTARKVAREKHRMEAFVRFQKTGDGIYYSVIEPDHDVLPLIEDHFVKRYADQQWMIYDAKRRYGLYYNGSDCTTVNLAFEPGIESGKNIGNIYDEKEEIYQQLWQQYFKSVNIEARKNTRLHIQHMPKRYWKFLVEKQNLPKS